MTTTSRCPSCNRLLDLGESRCRGCGQPIRASETPNPGQTRSSASVISRDVRHETYRSLDEMPPDVRAQAEAMLRGEPGAGSTVTRTKIRVRDADGVTREYNSLDELPPELADLRAQLADQTPPPRAERSTVTPASRRPVDEVVRERIVYRDPGLRINALPLALLAGVVVLGVLVVYLLFR